MATINNVQEDEPQPTALEKQVQVLTAAVECLTKQNQVLEEQLHRKVDNNIAEDLGDSCAERQDCDGPEGSNTPSRLERRNVSIPSLVDATLPLVFTEMQAMKEQMEVMMNALKGRVSSNLDDLVNRTDSPFTAVVNSFPLPHKFRMPHIDSYDGVKDLLDHLETFKILMHLQGVADEIMCRAFPTTLKEAARI